VFGEIKFISYSRP